LLSVDRPRRARCLRAEEDVGCSDERIGPVASSANALCADATAAGALACDQRRGGCVRRSCACPGERPPAALGSCNCGDCHHGLRGCARGNRAGTHRTASHDFDLEFKINHDHQGSPSPSLGLVHDRQRQAAGASVEIDHETRRWRGCDSAEPAKCYRC